MNKKLSYDDVYYMSANELYSYVLSGDVIISSEKIVIQGRHITCGDKTKNRFIAMLREEKINNIKNE